MNKILLAPGELLTHSELQTWFPWKEGGFQNSIHEVDILNERTIAKNMDVLLKNKSVKLTSYHSGMVDEN